MFGCDQCTLVTKLSENSRFKGVSAPEDVPARLPACALSAHLQQSDECDYKTSALQARSRGLGSNCLHR